MLFQASHNTMIEHTQQARKIDYQIIIDTEEMGPTEAVIAFDAGYAAQSLLAAIGCIQFVSNVIFASLVLKEQVSHM